MNKMKVMIFALGGLVAGVAIGLLLAPVSGQEARERLRKSTDDLYRKLGLRSDEFSESELEMDALTGRSFN
ncbi:MAG: YtxH-like protein [Chitinophagaceae bacterium]|jgi:gas vesicle protein|nr:YtxH-like protein [Chitinophagaceae bacterium]